MFNEFPKNSNEFNQQLQNIVLNKVILITGGTGSLGKALTKKLLKFHPKKIKVLSRSEENRATMKQEFRKLFGDLHEIIEYIPGSVTEADKIKKALIDTDIVFHLAAMKRVEECEQYPAEAIKVNCEGAKIITKLILKNGHVEHIIGASSDKACNPSNVYGNTKKAMEDIFMKAQKIAKSKHLKTKFSLVRGGNFLGSTGSVVPYWIKSAKLHNTLEVTDPNMRRFTLLLEEAADLFLWTLSNSQGGQIVTREMPLFLLGDLAEIISNAYNVPVKIVGARLKIGEKITEELISVTEKPFTIETDYPIETKYLINNIKFKIFVLTPGKYAIRINRIISDSYYYLTKDELKEMLKQGESQSGEWIPNDPIH